MNFLLLVFFFMQEPPVPPESLSPAQIFARCAKAHLGEKREIRIEDFKIEFNLVFKTEKGSSFEGVATHFFRQPDRVKTVLDDEQLGVRTETGFDGKDYWLHDKDRGTILLNGKEYAKDIAEIEERIRLSKILAKTFTIRRFMEDLKDARRLPDEKTAYGERIKVQARGSDFLLVKDPQILREADLILFFDRASFRLREIFVTPPPKEGSNGASPSDPLEKSEKIVFDELEMIQDILLPRRIRVFAGKEVRTPLYDITIGEFGYNVGLKEEDFKTHK